MHSPHGDNDFLKTVHFTLLFMLVWLLLFFVCLFLQKYKKFIYSTKECICQAEQNQRKKRCVSPFALILLLLPRNSRNDLAKEKGGKADEETG